MRPPFAKLVVGRRAFGSTKGRRVPKRAFERLAGQVAPTLRLVRGQDRHDALGRGLDSERVAFPEVFRPGLGESEFPTEIYFLLNDTNARPLLHGQLELRRDVALVEGGRT